MKDKRCQMKEMKAKIDLEIIDCDDVNQVLWVFGIQKQNKIQRLFMG